MKYLENIKKNSFLLSALVVFFFSFAFIFFTQYFNQDPSLSRSTESGQLANVGEANREYVPLSGTIPGLTDVRSDVENRERFASYLSNIYIWGVSIAVVLSIIMIILGGIQYMTTDSVSNKSDGKNKIKGAVVGLILALGSWLILNTINPQLVNLRVTVPNSDQN